MYLLKFFYSYRYQWKLPMVNTQLALQVGTNYIVLLVVPVSLYK